MSCGCGGGKRLFIMKFSVGLASSAQQFQSDPLTFICCLVSLGPSRLPGLPTITSATAYDSPSAANLRRGERCLQPSVAVWKSLGAQGPAFLGAFAPPAAIPAPALCDRARKRPEVRTYGTSLQALQAVLSRSTCNLHVQAFLEQDVLH